MRLEDTYIDDTERIGDLIVQVFADTTGVGDPRDGDNFTDILIAHRRYRLGDRNEATPGEDEAFEHGGPAALRKHLARQPEGLVAFSMLGMLDHSGVSIYTIADDSRGTAIGDSAGWDSGVAGWAFITRKQWDLIGGGDPEEMVDAEVRVGMGKLPVKRRQADVVLEAEIEEYNDWLTGNVWAFRVVKPCDHADEHDTDEQIADCPHSEEIESCYGFVGDPKYAWEEARASARPVLA